MVSIFSVKKEEKEARSCREGRTVRIRDWGKFRISIIYRFRRESTIG